MIQKADRLMRLFEAIVEANHRAVSGDKSAGLHPADFADSLPIVALTCIDARLNPLIPEVLGIPETEFISLRNAGNIITGPLSSTMRSLALACTVKGGKEIAIIGHTDCRVRQMSVVDLVDRFKAMGIDRARLPENLNEFFGLFASERQNVIRGVDFVRSSPLIGQKVPVHGLLLDIQTGKLEWLVNGYQSFAAETPGLTLEAKIGEKPFLDVRLPAFNLGEMKFPEIKIGDFSLKVESLSPQPERPSQAPAEPSQPAKEKIAIQINPLLRFNIIGEDQRKYGPVSGAKLIQWLAEGRVHAQTQAQLEGDTVWKALQEIAGTTDPPPIPQPPSLRPTSWRHKNR